MKTQEIYIEKLGDSIVFTLGTSAQENFDLIDSSQPEDLWFHVEGRPSCHVVASLNDLILLREIERKDKKVMLSIVKQGALLCKQHSKYASEKNLPVVYTWVKHVVKTDIVGSVNITNQKVICI
jgi:predicted ribosome quality control (RQC) complex YloA/Tae2 family protein